MKIDGIINICPAAELFAVYQDDDGEVDVLPVVCLANVMVTSGDPGEGLFGRVLGMISRDGGLVFAEMESSEAREFVGYWRSDVQEDIDDFLADHGFERLAKDEDEDEDEDEDDDE